MALDSIWKSDKTLEQRAKENHRDIDMQWIVENEANEFFQPSSTSRKLTEEEAMRKLEESNRRLLDDTSLEDLIKAREEVIKADEEEMARIKDFINGDDKELKVGNEEQQVQIGQEQPNGYKFDDDSLRILSGLFGTNKKSKNVPEEQSGEDVKREIQELIERSESQSSKGRRK